MSQDRFMRKKREKASEKTFTVDGKFLRDEAWDAIRSYFMPFAGLYAAFVGKEVRVVDRDALNSRNHERHSRRSRRKDASR
jgi:hypothetical protein